MDSQYCRYSHYTRAMASIPRWRWITTIITRVGPRLRRGAADVGPSQAHTYCVNCYRYKPKLECHNERSRKSL